MNQLENQKMTSYQDLYSSMETIDPSALSQQQDALASLFPGIPSLNSNMIDDWLADELCKSGLIPNSLGFVADVKHSILPHSPPISPSSSSMSDNASQKCASPKRPCRVSLFPEIANGPSPVPVDVSASLKRVPAPVVAIMPKPSLPRIAPRPSSVSSTPTIIMKEPATPIISNKRRSMEPSPDMDQDEIALKRQKNTDAARRSRLKKLVKMEHLEQRVSELESDNHRLNTRIAVLESEKSGLESKDVSLEDRIRVLETQLAEAHKALTKV